ncbi:MAG TPA: TadE family protein, partial [Candidatus Methylacidiphilales bacterium]|nr:TadE family protein [Candidatus Methylacidiphilales bacterium]
MKPNTSYLQSVRAVRRRCKSQAFVEFAFILPILLIMMCAVFDYSFMIMRMQIMAMAAREAANTATRQSSVNGPWVGVNAAYSAGAAQDVDFSGPNGAIVVTHVWYPSTNDGNEVSLFDSNYVGASAQANGSTNPEQYDPNSAQADTAVAGMGELFGANTNDLYDASHLLVGGGNNTNGNYAWESIYRQLPFPGYDLVPGDTRGLYAVEVFYTNSFITPLGSLLTHSYGLTSPIVPTGLYDAAFYGVITGTPTSSITLPPAFVPPPVPPPSPPPPPAPSSPPPPPAPPSPPSPPSPPPSPPSPPPPPRSPPPPPPPGTTNGSTPPPPPPPPPPSPPPP